MRRLLALGLVFASLAGTALGADPTTVGTDKSPAGLLAADQARYTAMVARDWPTLDRLLGDDLIYVHSQGNAQNKAQHFGDTKSGRALYNQITVVGALARVYGDFGIIWGDADFDELKSHHVTRLGYAETWAWRDNHWQMVVFHCAHILQPGDKPPSMPAPPPGTPTPPKSLGDMPLPPVSSGQ